MMLTARVVGSGMAQLSRVVASIQKSCELAGKRKSSVPVVTYPEALVLRYAL